jgi:hypothetical protein
MKKLIFLLVLISNLAFAQEETAKTYYSVKADINGRLIIVPQSEEDKYLIYFENFEHSNDGKAKLYQREWINQNAWVGTREQAGYRYRLIGTGREELVNRGHQIEQFGSKVPTMNLKLAGKMPIDIAFGEISNLADVRMVEEKYWQYMGLGKSKIQVKKQLKADLAATNSACSSAIKLEIAWPEFEAIDQKTVPGFLQSHIKALRDICAIDGDYLEAVKSISSITVSPGKHAVNLHGNVLEVHFNRDSANIPDTAYDKIYSAL